MADFLRATNCLLLIFFLFGSLFHLVHLVIMADKPGCGHTWHASQEPQGHLVVMEPKETWAARGRLGPRDHVVLMERKEQRETLGSKVQPDRKDSEGTKATVELLHTRTGRSVPGQATRKQIQGRYSEVNISACFFPCLFEGKILLLTWKKGHQQMGWCKSISLKLNCCFASNKFNAYVKSLFLSSFFFSYFNVELWLCEKERKLCTPCLLCWQPQDIWLYRLLYFTFNGAECNSPGSIDGVFYIGTPNNVNHNFHNHRHIEGHCKNIQKGSVRVGFWVGNCKRGGYMLGDAFTGWHNAMNRIFIEEVPPAQQ